MACTFNAQELHRGSIWSHGRVDGPIQTAAILRVVVGQGFLGFGGTCAVRPYPPIAVSLDWEHWSPLPAYDAAVPFHQGVLGAIGNQQGRG